MSESIYAWITPAPVPAPKSPRYVSKHPGDAPVPCSTLREAALTKPTGIIGRETRDTIKPETFLRSTARSAAKGDAAEAGAPGEAGSCFKCSSRWW